MPREKDVEHMNRFELMNEVERIKGERDRYKKQAESLSFYQNENHEQNLEIERLRSQQVIVAQYFDVLGQTPGFEMWLDVADDLRCGRLISPKKFVRQSQRTTRDRRVQPQGRRKGTRR